MSKTLKVLSAVLSYPTVELQAAVPQLTAAVAEEALLPTAIRRQLDTLCGEIANGDLYDLQVRYVLLFDRTRSLSLHLFEHVHGESRDRGNAMIELKTLYEQGGLDIDAAELPDFVPLFLEFASTQSAVEACALLAQPVHIFAALAERLRRRRSGYEAIFRALIALATDEPKADALSALLAEPDPDATDFAALDAAWEDEPVSFGPGAGDGCKDGLIARIRAGLRPAPGLAKSPAAKTPAAPTPLR
jgi:nitrate reductase delta subunit